MPTIVLKTPVWDENGKLYRPGKVEVPEALAKRLGKSTEGKTVEEKPQDAYPYADILSAGGYKDWAAVNKATDEQLLALDGIGPARLKEIREFKS